MQQYYQPLYQRARDLQFKVHDAMGDQNHPMARTLRNEVQHLTDDLEMQKNPRDIENRIKTIQHTLLESQNTSGSVMNVDHSANLHRNYELMRVDVRRLPHY